METPIIKALEVHRESELITEVNNVVSDTTQETVITSNVLDFSVWEPVLFNASYMEGEKIILGKVLPTNKTNKYISFSGDTDSLAKYTAEIYYTSSTNTSLPAADQTGLIVTTPLYLNQKGEIEFLLRNQC